VWCEQYDRTLSDIFALQDDISRSVLTALEVELLKSARRPLFKPSTESMEAYLLYLQGRSFWHQRFAGQLQRAMECFEQAIQRDPRFALAYTGLADSFGSLGVWGFLPPHDAFPRAAALARQSLALDPALAEAHASLALIHMFYDWDWADAEQKLARAIELNPGHALTHLWAGHFLSIVGRFDEALAEVLHAQALDPLSPSLNANVGWTFHLAGQQDRAIDELQRVLARFPGNPMALLYLGFAYVEAGKREEALTSLRAATEAPGGIPFAAESVGWVLGLAGDAGGARAILGRSLARLQTSYIPSSAIACIFLGLGEDGPMFEWLERAAEERDALMPWLGFMPAFNRVRPNPRFRALLTMIGLA
jgi:serine/threonine-protein kinase